MSPPSESANPKPVGRPRPKSQVKIKRRPVIAHYRIAGEVFSLEVRRGRVFITHPRWSLMGVGKTLAQADKALRNEAGVVARVYGEMPANTLDVEALRLYHFALRIS